MTVESKQKLSNLGIIDLDALIVAEEQRSGQSVNREIATLYLETIRERVLHQLERELTKKKMHLPDVEQFMTFLPPLFQQLLQQRTSHLEPRAGYSIRIIDEHLAVEGYVDFRDPQTELSGAHLTLFTTKGSYTPYKYREYKYTKGNIRRVMDVMEVTFDTTTNTGRVNMSRDLEPRITRISYFAAGAGELVVAVPYLLPEVANVQDLIAGKDAVVGPVKKQFEPRNMVYLAETPQVGMAMLGVNSEHRGAIVPNVPVFKSSGVMLDSGVRTNITPSFTSSGSLEQLRFKLREQGISFWQFLESQGYDLSTFPRFVTEYKAEEILIPYELLR
jgi:hypothetical protein